MSAYMSAYKADVAGLLQFIERGEASVFENDRQLVKEVAFRLAKDYLKLLLAQGITSLPVSDTPTATA